MTEIYIGTSSFADPSVIPYFYPQGLKPGERITFYSRYFNSVEIDSSYYALPSERNSLLFIQRTPADFVFNFKAFRLMTLHGAPVSSLGRTLRGYLPADFDGDWVSGIPNEELKLACFKMFFSALLPLRAAGKLGYVLFQFPPWFKKNDENIEYLHEIRNLSQGWPLAIEFRHGSWLLNSEAEDTFSILRKLDMVYCIADEPQVGIYGSVPALIGLTSKDSYIRFHGRNTEVWLKKDITVQERFKYLYSKEELEEWAEIIKDLSLKAERTFLFFNNCFAYYALKNARMMADMLGVLKDKEPLNIIEPDSFQEDQKLF